MSEIQLTMHAYVEFIIIFFYFELAKFVQLI